MGEWVGVGMGFRGSKLACTEFTCSTCTYPCFLLYPLCWIFVVNEFESASVDHVN